MIDRLHGIRHVAVGGRVEQAADIVKQRRARLGGAALIAVAVGEKEPATGQREADVEEVALLGVGVAARRQPERGALALREKRVAAAVAARELAVLEGADEEVVKATRPQPVGAGDPHPPLDRAAPGAKLECRRSRGQLLGAGRWPAQIEQLRERA